MKRIIQYFLMLVVLAAITGGFYWYLQYESFYPSTDDAYVQANVVNINAQVSGSVDKIYVKTNQHVGVNQLLFSIDKAPFNIALTRAKASLAKTRLQVAAAKDAVDAANALVMQREAQYNEAKKHADRIMTLVHKRIQPDEKGDQAMARFQVAQATLKAAKSELSKAKQDLGLVGKINVRIKEAKAKVDEAKLNLAHTDVSAPASGLIVNFKLRKGDFITAGRPQFALIEDKNWWINANFKETQLKRIKPGQSAQITLDIYPDHTFKGVVVSISAGSGASFSLLPAENASGNWVKVVQRFAVRVKILNPDSKYPLRVGASSTVKVNTLSS